MPAISSILTGTLSHFTFLVPNFLSSPLLEFIGPLDHVPVGDLLVVMDAKYYLSLFIYIFLASVAAWIQYSIGL